MKRLLAGILAVCLLALAGLESFHAHATAHDKSCAACSLEMQATGIAVHSPKAPVVSRSCSAIVLVADASAAVPYVAFCSARAPPDAA